MWQRLNQRVAAAFESPIFWGGIATIGFYWAISVGAAPGGPLEGGLIARYFASHWAEYLEASLFFVGAAALLLRLLDTRRQQADLVPSPLADVPQHARTADAVDAVLARLQSLSRRQQASYLVERLTAACEHIRRQQSADGLDDHLKYLTDDALDRAHAGYGLVRTIAWAIPIVGFLGTVIGITLAIANLSPQSLDESLSNVTGGLGVAFDTTALALSLSIVLMFTLFVVERRESQLLAEVDRGAADELARLFAPGTTTHDPHLLSVRRMIEGLVGSHERLAHQQAAAWNSAVDTTNDRWQALVDDIHQRLEGALAEALGDGLAHHARRVAEIESDLTSRTHAQWQSATQAINGVAERLESIEQQISERTELLRQLGATADEVSRLQSSLDANLAAVTGTAKFDETLLSLSTAIQLLAARANLSLADRANDSTHGDARKGQAA
ncbi:MAG: MotA/TolQ/ExbB proton channel family protein [Planctomycetales bacterium]|nr:MotA/TolQ/ExbB proton channel family protein [Planctomycetales bacterium]